MILKVYKCSCRSPWCKKCAKGSPTNERIRARLKKMDWRQVRHVVLTVTRDRPPALMYDSIRLLKSIPLLIRSLHLSDQQWLWVLEFHRGGYPHWHLLIESPRGMIGKRAIEARWEWGLVWESYIRSEEHWGAIIGYHQAKGYLAGENKEHQLELPPWCMTRSRVRKFAGNANKDRDLPANVPRGTSAYKKHREPDRTYAEKLRTCGRGVRVGCAGQWAEGVMDHAEAIRIAGSRLQSRGKGEFEGPAPAAIRAANRIIGG